MKKFILSLIFLPFGLRAQSVYTDTISNRAGELCATITPQAIPFFTPTTNISRIAIGAPIQFDNGNVSGRWYIEYQIGVDWFVLTEGRFSIQMDQNLSMIAARVPLFQYLKYYLQVQNGVGLNISY